MEVTALCIRLLTTELLLLCALDQKVDSVSLGVVPNRLQFFEYEPLAFHCEGFCVSPEWKDVHKFKGKLPSCKTASEVTSTRWSCTVQNLYADDSGEYWCETGEGKRSSSINITVTAGSVILESPARPATDGEAVTLRCRNKTTSNLTADFYKDGHHIGSSSTGNMTIPSVFKSDEGLYKCNISGAGESAESWLAVREASIENIPSSSSTSSYPTPWIIVTVLLLVLLLFVGLLHLGKGPWRGELLNLSTLTPGSGPAEDQTVSAVYRAVDADKATYPAETKSMKRDEDEMSPRAVYYTLGLGGTQQLEPALSSVTARSVPSPGTDPLLAEDAFYSIYSS